MDVRVCRERLTLLLLVLLPFHALFVTVATRVVAGEGHPPLGALAVWKEGLLALIVLLALGELAWKRLRHRYWIEFDAIDGLIVLLTMLAVLVGIRLQALLSPPFVHGFRYDLFLPLCFVVLRRATWSDAFRRAVPRALVATGAAVACAGVVLWLLPLEALQGLGYGGLHSLYQSGAPLAPFQQIGETGIRRMQSVMSGPNQLGLWMLLPLSALLLAPPVRGWKRCMLLALVGLAIALSFSRAAWLAALLVAAYAAATSLSGAARRRALLGLAAGCALAVMALLALQPAVVLRAVSNSRHIARPLEAIAVIRQRPLGLGLGAAGPAANRRSDTCVELPAGADASWAAAHPQLCVFVGGVQTQPQGRTCTCPLLPENWYLQIGVELGVLGLLLYLALMARVLWAARAHPFVLAAFGSVAAAGMVLHSFEDFGVSATLWVLLAVLL